MIIRVLFGFYLFSIFSKNHRGKYAIMDDVHFGFLQKIQTLYRKRNNFDRFVVKCLSVFIYFQYFPDKVLYKTISCCGGHI